MSIDMSRYLDLFIQEARDHVEALGQELVALEQTGGADHLDALFRHAHSLKGMSASMGFEVIAELSHELEGLMSARRGAAGKLPEGETDLALAAADLLGERVEEVEASGEAAPADARSKSLLASLKQAAVAARGEAAPPPPPNWPASPTPNEEADTEALAPEEADTASSSVQQLPLIEVRAQVDAESRVPGVRAFLVYKRLSTHGEVVSCIPPLEAMKVGNLEDGELYFLIATRVSKETLLQSLSTVSEITGLGVEHHHVAPAPMSPSQKSRPVVAADRGGTVRVRTRLLDDLMDSSGDLLQGIYHLRTLLPGPLRESGTVVGDAVDRLDKAVRLLNHQVVEARMTPIHLLFDRLPRMVRDLSRSLDRKVELVLEGGEIELDRAILDVIDAPITHLLRNGMDHGLESAEVRKAQGKPEIGVLRVSARRDRNHVVISVEDDGQGLNLKSLGEKAVARGKISEVECAQLSDRELAMLATLPGLSTRQEVSAVSGRGVGLDVVRDAVEGLGGSLEIDTALGEGTCFVLRLPLTVAIQKLLLIKSDAQLFAFPVSKVLHVIEFDRSAWSSGEGPATVPFMDQQIEAWDLRRWSGPPRPLPERSAHVVVEGEGGGPLSVAVDGFAGHLEALIKPLEPPLSHLRGLSGVTFLPEGRPVFVLDLASLVRSAEHW